MMFAMVMVPLIAVTGAAIDFSRAYEQRLVVQDALDSAALAANRLIGLASEEEIYAEAMAFFNANTEGRLDNTLTLSMRVDGGTVALSTDLPVPTSFLGVIGIENINFDISSVSVAGAATYEVVMVLDNSTSMRGSKLSALQIAATDMINSLFGLSASNPADEPVRIGLVPFSASVNVGAANANASWMDTGGNAPNAAINFDWDDDVPTATPFTNRFDLFNDLANVDWLGCVEARAHPYDVTDATPTNAIPATLYQPMFAPDEPDDGNGVDNDYRNNYLDDDGGVCDVDAAGPGGGGDIPWWCSWFPSHPSCQISAPGDGEVGVDHCANGDEYERCLQERVCKYEGVNGLDFNGRGEGPNLHCTANAITPMSTSQATLLAAVNAMTAPRSPAGYTNIEQGVVWGWRALSDTAPFTEGRAYGDGGNHKVLIVMTDGANTYIDQNTINRSEYMAFNYIYHGYLDVAQNNPNSGDIVAAMNERTLEVCSNIHDTEITVYTIAFQVEDDDAQQILLECASDSSKAFDAGDNAELIAAFQLIAQDIATLRIAR